MTATGGPGSGRVRTDDPGPKVGRKGQAGTERTRLTRDVRLTLPLEVYDRARTLARQDETWAQFFHRLVDAYETAGAKAEAKGYQRGLQDGAAAAQAEQKARDDAWKSDYGRRRWVDGTLVALVVLLAKAELPTALFGPVADELAARLTDAAFLAEVQGLALGWGVDVGAALWLCEQMAHHWQWAGVAGHS